MLIVLRIGKILNQRKKLSIDADTEATETASLTKVSLSLMVFSDQSSTHLKQKKVSARRRERRLKFRTSDFNNQRKDVT